MAEQRLVILRHVRKVPDLAACERCGTKFFTPAKFAVDPTGAKTTSLPNLNFMTAFNPRESALRKERESRQTKVMLIPAESFHRAASKRMLSAHGKHSAQR